ncbi:uncharacterized protein LOC106665006 [Cimex lectularius]|uniref:Protein sleepless n=1 Tax=Cimex lectularius TaxID=79782 RepID=A0A8I6RMI4_CIMLE|nr:uncharacterized protein LOC106665006 [Cimex lectularius]
MRSLIRFSTFVAVLTTCLALNCYQCNDDNNCGDSMSPNVKVRECPTSLSEYSATRFLGEPVKAKDGKDEIFCFKLTASVNNVPSNITVRDCFPNINCSTIFSNLQKNYKGYSATCRTCNYNLCNGSSSILATSFSIFSTFLISSYYFS